MIKIGQKIKHIRQLKRLTQMELAKNIGVSDKAISSYESERVNPPFSVLERIAKSTNQTISYFVEDSSEETILEKLRSVEEELREIRKLLKEDK